MSHKIPKNILESAIVEQLKQIFDPEIPVDIYNLGLIYDIIIDDDYNVQVVMTLTAPNCPVADSLPEEVKTRVAATYGVSSAEVKLTFDPTWTKDFMSEEAKLMLGMM
jgi:FeS assembly SUF system protein